MNTTIQSTLLDLCQQVIEDPDHVPIIPLDVWPEGTDQQHLLASFRDMLERMQQHYQDKLEAQERFSLAVEGANDGLWVQHLQTNEAYFSQRWKSMLGYEEDEISNSVDEWLLRLHPEDIDRVLEFGRANIAGEIDTYEIEYRLRHKDGSYRWVLSRATTLRDAGGKAYRLAGSNTDITERKLAEQQLREKEEQYRSIFETTTDGLVIFDLDGFIVEANPAACDVYGCTYEELIGLHISVLTHPDTLALMAEAFQRIQAGSQVQNRAITLHKDGTPFYAEGHATPFTYKGKLHMLVVVRDITEQVEAEQQLRDREEQYRSIFEATYDALFIMDLDGFLIEVNPAFCRMFGYPYEEVIGLHAGVLTGPVSLPSLAEALKTLKTGRGTQTEIGQGLRKDGTTFYVESQSTTLTYRGKPHALGVVRDITERVEAEQQLREREEQYRSIFEATTDGLTINDLEDGHVVEANPAACQMYGYSYEEMIGLPVTATIHPDSFHHVSGVLQAIPAGGHYQARLVAMRKDGTTFHVDGRGTPFMYKGKPHLLGVIRDITEQVQAEGRLHEREEQYRSIFEATYDGLVINDLDGFCVEANPTYCRLLGYTSEEMIGLHYSQTTFPEYYPVLDENSRAIRAGAQYQTQGLARRKDGSALPVEALSIPFTYKGKPHMLGVMRDITERVQAEQQLREKEEQYRSIFEATIDGLIISNLRGLIIEANPAACKMYGYTYEEFVGLHGTDITSQDTHFLLAEALQTIRTDSKSLSSIRATGLRKDDTMFPTEGYGTRIMYKGKPHILAVVRDITEQVRAEEQLREKEEQYRSIFEATTDGLIIRDMGGFVVEANPAAYTMHGYTYQEFIGLHRTNIIAPEDHSMVAEYMKAIQAGRTFRGQAVDLRKDGSAFPVEVRGSLFTYLGKPHTLSVLRDISERVQAEQQLREKEEQYRSIFEATNDGLDILDPDGFIVEANPAFCSMFGYTREELIGMPAGTLTAPQSLHLVEESRESIKEGRDIQVEGLALRKDGSVFHAEAHLTALIYQGKPHMLGVTRDITEQVQAQQLLEQRVEERTRELSTLLEVSHNVASTIELKPLLDLILDQLKAVVDYTGSSLTILDHEDLVLVGSRGPEPEEHLIQRRFSLKHLGLIWEMICRREPVIIDDVRDDAPLAQGYREAVGELLQTTLQYVHSWIAVPLIVKERVIGMLAASHSESKYYEPRHATLALAIANQAAIAIENARLYEQAQELAAVEERQRLARELHDSVSQALYGISLGVHTARLQVGHNPDELAESLDYVLELAEAALTEMRALIFELRPESLEAEGLVTALTKQAAALHARHGIKVELDLCGEPDVSLKVKRELYRVAQEALHNTVKHAEASRVDLRLRLGDGEVILEVRDDGKGFEATGSFPGHLGLHSMRERIESLDGGLQIESAPGQGTSIRAYIPTRKTTELMIGE